MFDHVEKIYVAALMKLESWVESAIGILPNVVVAVTILIAFNFLSSWLKANFNKVFIKRFSSPFVVHLIAIVIKVTVLALGFMTALSVLGLDKAIISILAGAGVLGLALGFALQDIVQNFISGIFIGVNKPFVVGDNIEAHSINGIVKQITLKNTVIQQANGVISTVPNKDIFQGIIHNFTQAQERRIEIKVGVDYGSDLLQAKAVIFNAISRLSCLKGDKPVNVFITMFDDYSVMIAAQFWVDLTNKSTNPGLATTEGIVAIHQALREAKIEIPSPMRVTR